MDLWSNITGFVTVELTAAQPMIILDKLVKTGASIRDVRSDSDLTVRFTIAGKDMKQLRLLTQHRGGTLKCIGHYGAALWLENLLKRPVLILTLAAILMLSVFLPGRILFIEVQGCETVPPRLVLETAARFGLEFGAGRRNIRSEYIKNELLSAMPELEWVGVNTAGSTATILLRERKMGGEREDRQPCHIVALCNSIVEEITLTRGTLLCNPGDAVRAGQVLVSGYEDLGITTRAVSAHAEIYGRTSHVLTARIPPENIIYTDRKPKWLNCSLIIGKKRINLYSDGGILPPTCGKMRQVIPLRLPGGKMLPVWLVMEKGELCNPVAVNRDGTETLLASSARKYILEKMVAGSIVSEQTELSADGTMVCTYECRQMIAIQRSDVILEGDTKE